MRASILLLTALASLPAAAAAQAPAAALDLPVDRIARRRDRHRPARPGAPGDGAQRRDGPSDPSRGQASW